MIYNSHQSNIHERNIHPTATVHSHVWIGLKVKIPQGCRVQAFAFLPNGVTIGKNVFIGPHVCFTNDKHPPSSEWSDTIVEEGASIGAGSIILPGITIGVGAKIGAGSVVTKDVPDGETWYGNPAKKHG